jgi:23S rRNA (pseudouridine1915-N3)-methyltransferase
MRVSIRCLGRWDRAKEAAPLRALFEGYARRLPWPVQVQAVAGDARAPAAAKRRQDTERLRKGLRERAVVVALDAGGKALDSREFARQLQSWLASGANELVFLVGGRDGLDPTAVREAHLVLSLGAMTWPHRLVPVMLAEQLYRAHCILTGHPYQGEERRAE